VIDESLDELKWSPASRAAISIRVLSHQFHTALNYPCEAALSDKEVVGSLSLPSSDMQPNGAMDFA